MGKMVSIIILNWNGMKFTVPCLRSIRKNTRHKPYEIIVVDNGSSEGEVEELRRLKEKGEVGKLILNSENRGFAGANNQGLEAAAGSYLMLLNNDTLVTRGWLQELVRAADSDERIGIVQPDLPESPGKSLPYTGGYIDDSGTARFVQKEGGLGLQDVEIAGGAAFFIKRKLLERVGLLDEGFNPIYFEECDYCARARKAGSRCVFTPKSTVIHFGSKITTKQPGKWMYLTINKNRVRYVLLHFSKARLAKAVFWEALRIGKNVLNGRIFWLLKAYWINLKNIGEIRDRRREYAKMRPGGND